MSQTCLLILGPERSGQSLVSRVLAQMGVDFGAPLTPPTLDDAIGTWRHQRLSRWTQEALGYRGQTTLSLKPLPVIPALDDLSRSTLVTTLRHMGWQQESATVALAEPGLGRLLPLVRPVLTEAGLSVQAVLCVRAPMAMAGALSHWDQLSPDQAVALWIVHLADALTGTEGLEVPVIRPEQVVRRFQQGLEAIPAAWLPPTPPEATQAVTQMLLTLDKRAPAPVPDSAVNPMLLGLAEQCYAEVTRSPVVDDQARGFLRDARAHLHSVAGLGLTEGVGMAATILANAERSARAVTVLEGLAPVIGGDPAPWIQLAQLQIKAQRLTSAAEALSRATEIVESAGLPVPPALALETARLQVTRGQAGAALRTITQALKIEPRHAGLLTQWARLALSTGQAAEVAPQIAQRLGPLTPDPALALALAHLWAEAGHTATALALLHACADAWPDAAEVGALISDLSGDSVPLPEADGASTT